MMGVHVPWIELAIVLPIVGAFWVRWLRDPDVAREHSLWISAAALVCACAAWLSLDTSGQAAPTAREQGREVFVIDELSGPLLPLAALLFLLVELATLRT